jgi:pimeloyl-ACP methyl ester carboxylesterase
VEVDMSTTAAHAAVAPTFLTSDDGTGIGVWRSGTGPPLVMVHGSMADHTTLARVVPLLEPHLTVYAVDRRGRGASGDAPEYAIEREYDDLAVVVDSIAQQSGGPVALYGHSFGATCALGAVLRSPDVGRLVLYEPAFRGVFDYPDGLLDRITALVTAGRAEAALDVAMRERAGASAVEVDAMRVLPSWARRVAAAGALPRELRLDATLAFDPSAYATCTTPTLLLLGEHSPAGQRSVVQSIDAALPDCRIVELPGQEHLAQVTAPHLVAEALLGFVLDGEVPGS